ncbi:hypothetical protein SARC_09577 [Sphaeroforma arctica JP610]|uniref:Vps41 beta-propeller domain-containing protein n=1 Tax=Sphaeroforma arctica JP610 TaxID=667725 RepID=A0A0L0FMH8_9EUKA|nr:hypothetical protein SARC_09577 [Sphaeroforma arctica JP610]KNC77974.1 hypothetical protein SARC_09577 [Sphaeroforma arctica JP610]|eukprot:XP_014151876.1 hypothetical protein SARC_09577 [Sphaeroforma arctica JP610]
MPLYGVGLSPGYAKDNKRFATGGAAGRLTMNDKGWISSVKTKVLHSEDGPVYALAWRGRYIVWACDKGIMVWDVQAHRRITLIRRPKDSPPPDAFNCSLCWRDDHTFVIGWADSIRVAAIKAKVTGDSRATTGMFVEIIGMFRTEYWVCGVAPYLSDSLVVLAYIPEEEVDPSEDNDEGVIEGDVLQHGTARKPELVITSLSNEETSSDALSIVNYEQYIANDYHMAFLEEEHIYFVVSPKDIVVARQRDSDDHVSWLLDHEKYPEALVAVREGEEKKELRVHTIESVGDHYIEHLLSCTRYDEAADVCRDIYDTNAEGWQKWIDMFLKKGQARAIAPLVPTENPQLPSEVYTSLLLSLAEGEVAECTVLRELIGQWDAHLYSSAEAKTAVLDNLRVAEGERERLLKSTLAQIYRDMDKPHKAVPILLDLGEGDVLELIYEHALSEQLLAHLDRLLVLDREKTIQYLLDHKEQIKVNTIVDKLRKDPLHLFYYLDALSSEDLAAGAPFHDLQVALCAEYAPEKLMELLKHSNFYSLEKALQVCRERDLVPQTVFLYSRIGNNKQALQLIIDRLGDVHMAINFAKEQNDAELWDDLIVYSADKPEFIRGLLNNIGTHVDPIVLIRRIPLGLPIPGLRDSLVKIMQDFNLQVSLREGCQKILIADVLTLMNVLVKQRRRGTRLGMSLV